MTIKLDYDLSRERFERALTLARSDAHLPAEWIERSRLIGQASSKTYVAVLGTALLAHATNRELDPFALRVGDSEDGYSARNLCKTVLVPSAVAAGIHVGVTGREPLNNRPFISAPRITPELDVPAKARPYLDQLCDALTALKPLDEEQAAAGLAAFLRVRIEDAPLRAAPLVVERSLGVTELTSSISRFISSNPENGKRGQALAAACLDLLFSRVKTTRVYDPSRRWPGDVVAFIRKRITVAVEVKQRPASATELLQFAARCATMKVHRATVALLSPSRTL